MAAKNDLNSSENEEYKVILVTLRPTYDVMDTGGRRGSDFAEELYLFSSYVRELQQ